MRCFRASPRPGFRGVFCVGVLTQETLSSLGPEFPGISAANGGFPPVASTQTQARSGRAAAATGALSTCAWSGAVDAWRCAPAPAFLTPARWLSLNNGGPSCGAAMGPGVVPVRNLSEPLGEPLTHWNGGIIRVVPLVPRFRTQPDARAGTRARAYRVFRRNHGTTEPDFIIYLYQLFSGSVLVLERFRDGTGVVLVGQVPDLASVRHILGVGNARCGRDRCASGARSGRNEAGVARSFRVFGRAPGELEQLGRVVQVRCGNGGNRPFSGGAIGHVGSLALEGWAQGAGFARAFGAARQLGRLRPACLVPPIGARGRETPPCPHSARPDPLARWQAGLPAFGSASAAPGVPARAIDLPAQCAQRVRGGAKAQAGLTGRGEGWRRTQAASAATGRGRADLDQSCRETALHRSRHASAGGDRVN